MLNFVAIRKGINTAPGTSVWEAIRFILQYPYLGSCVMEYIDNPWLKAFFSSYTCYDSVKKFNKTKDWALVHERELLAFWIRSL